MVLDKDQNPLNSIEVMVILYLILSNPSLSDPSSSRRHASPPTVFSTETTPVGDLSSKIFEFVSYFE